MNKNNIPDNIFGLPLKVGIKISQVVLLGVTAVTVSVGFVYHPSFFIISGITVVMQLPFIIVRSYLSNTKKSNKLNKKAKQITNAQVFGLLDKKRPTITAKRLAGATNSTEEAAEEKLKTLAINGKLRGNVPTESYEIVYSDNNQELLE